MEGNGRSAISRTQLRVLSAGLPERSRQCVSRRQRGRDGSADGENRNGPGSRGGGQQEPRRRGGAGGLLEGGDAGGMLAHSRSRRSGTGGIPRSLRGGRYPVGKPGDLAGAGTPSPGQTPLFQNRLRCGVRPAGSRVFYRAPDRRTRAGKPALSGRCRTRCPQPAQGHPGCRADRDRVFVGGPGGGHHVCRIFAGGSGIREPSFSVGRSGKFPAGERDLAWRSVVGRPLRCRPRGRGRFGRA